MGAAETQRVLARLREMFLRAGEQPGSRWLTEEVRDAGDEAVLVGRFDRDPRRYGIPIAVTDRSHEFYYTGCPVADDDEWLDSVGLGIEIMLDTGFRASARRRVVEDYIELREEGGWPYDERYVLQDGSIEVDRLAEGLRRDGLDPSLADERRAEGRLRTWVLAYVNTAPSGPWVGHAVVTGDAGVHAVLEQVEIGPGAPVSLRLELAYYACHAAAADGALTVSTTLTYPELALAGFRPSADGGAVLDTSFLDADPDGARAILEADSRSGHE